MANDYLKHYNHNHDKIGRFTFSKGGSAVKSAASSVGSALLRKKKKPVPPAADIKSRKGGSKSDNTKLGKDEKARLMNSGSLDEINKNKDRLSNKELEFAINRIQKDRNDRANLEKRLSELNGPEAQSTIQKGAQMVEKAAKSGMTMKDLAEKGMAAWNLMAKIHNATSTPDDKWVTFDKNGNPQANGDPASVSALMSRGNISEILKNKDKLTTDQLRDAVERQKQLDALEKYNNQGNEKLPKGVLSDKEKGEIIDSGDYDKLSKNIDQFSPKQVEKALNNYATKQANDKRIEDINYENKKNSINVTPYDTSNAPPSQVYPEQKPKKQGLFSKAKDTVNESINSYKPVDRNAYEQRLNQYEKQARSDAQSYRENSSSGSSASDLLRDLSGNSNSRPNSTVDTSRSYEVSSRPTFNYEPSDTVRDFVNIYASQKIPEGSTASKALDVANIGYDIYKQRRKKNY